MEIDLINRETADTTIMRDTSLTTQERMAREFAMLGKFYTTAAKIELRLNNYRDALVFLARAIMKTRFKNANVNAAFLTTMQRVAKDNPDSTQFSDAVPDSARMMMMPLSMALMNNDTLWKMYSDVAPRFPKIQSQLNHFKSMRQNAPLFAQKLRQRDFCKWEYRAFAPDFSLLTADGKTVTLASLKGKTVVLDFWGSWCPTCSMTMPNVDSVYRDFKSNDSVVFFAVDCGEHAKSIDSLANAAEKFLDKINVTIPVLFDRNNAAVDSFGVLVFPAEIIIDKHGIVRAWHPKRHPEDLKDVLEFELGMISSDNACAKR